jgi:formamidopyrimidine-DNA glycosylase
MPELPEVETIVRDLKEKVLKKTISNVWTDAKEIIKKPKNFEDFKKELINTKILNIERRGKNIIFFLSNQKILLIHQKLTGHLLFGKWKKKNKTWVSEIEGPLKKDPMNQFLHLIFFFKDGWQLALSDLRKFAKVEILTKEELKKEINQLGPEPLDKNFKFEDFKKRILEKKSKEIKKVLMDQKIIAGIGNIYSDEILWEAKVHPLKIVENLKEDELKNIYKAMKKILPKAIKLGGESFLTYRKINGEKGKFDLIRKVYKREKEECFRCKSKIERIKINQRSTHFCPRCQKL